MTRKAKQKQNNLVVAEGGRWVNEKNTRKGLKVINFVKFIKTNL